MRSSLRILFVTHNIPRFAGDAAGSFILRLAVALQQSGAQIKVIAPGTSGEGSNSSADCHDVIEGVPITRVRYGSDKQMTLAYEGNMAETVRASWSGKMALVRLMYSMRRAVHREIRSAVRAGESYNLVHAHWWFPSGLALWHPALVPNRMPPLVITMHGSDVRLALAKSASHPIMRSVLRQAAAVTAVSSWLREQANTIAPTAPIEVSPMPVNINLFSDPFDGSPIPNERKGVLFVGRLNEQKGISDLLVAMTNPSLANVPLVVVGDGPASDSLKTKAGTLGLTQRITWVGALPHNQLRDYYRRAAVVAIPSRMEGLGLVAVEAQLSGAPVVAYAEGGIVDVVNSTNGGVLVPPGDTKALGEAIASLISLAENNPEQRDLLAREARTSMLNRFSPEAVAARYLKHYEQAILHRMGSGMRNGMRNG